MGKKTLREIFEDNYTAVPIPANNAKGFKMKYIYYAPWYFWNLPDRALKNEKRLILLCSLAGFLCFLLSSTRVSELNRMPVIFVPCALALCCHVVEFFHLVQFAAAKEKTTKMTFDEVDKALRFFPGLRCAACGFCALACVCLWILGYRDSDIIRMPAGFAAAAITAWAVQKRYSRIPHSVAVNHTLKEMESAEENENNEL